MKMKVLLALWTCYILSSLTARSEETDSDKQFTDTIVMVADTNIKIVFIGSSMQDLSKYNRIDTITNMFIDDLKKAKMRADYPKSPKTTHYFINENNKRRIKTESEDYLEQAVDVEREKTS